jgi:hypothetical protein
MTGQKDKRPKKLRAKKQWPGFHPATKKAPSSMQSEFAADRLEFGRLD